MRLKVGIEWYGWKMKDVTEVVSAFSVHLLRNSARNGNSVSCYFLAKRTETIPRQLNKTSTIWRRLSNKKGPAVL